ncbi:MAG: hypothetical protein MUC97_19440 [Bernardetiaceae bacterium]|jgi:hypothetical protein|nr:hypothetical protein [Bernardetiaceae bacterium]
MFIICRPWLFKLLRRPPAGMALWPFVLLHHEGLRHDAQLINHERIHLRQELELLVLPFYLCYGANYLANLARYRDHDLAYRHICFEREAYANAANPHYLRQRPWFAFWRYLFK